jgi:hypothetical protein
MVELEPADARMLVELGFIAFSYGLQDRAEAIFAGVQVARPQHEAGFIGAALVQLARGEINTAISMLSALPPTEAARTFLAIALHRSGERVEAREILTDVINTAAGTPYADLARALLTGFEKQQQPPIL